MSIQADNDAIIPGFSRNAPDGLTVRLSSPPDTDIIVLFLEGQLDSFNSSTFLKNGEMIVDYGFSRLVVDCTGLASMASTGIGALVALLKKVRPSGGELVLVGMSVRVLEVFQLLGFNRYFKITNDMAEAMAMVKGGGQDAVFPRAVACPVCATRLRVSKSGRFRCAKCATILAVDNRAEVLLG